MISDNFYKPIVKELNFVENQIRQALLHSSNVEIVEICRYLLSYPGKRLRPALVLLSAKSISPIQSQRDEVKICNVAAALELIHLASLLHDDVIDEAVLRHHNPSINERWGSETAVILGDYIYSVAFSLISQEEDGAVLNCVVNSSKFMCEGEFVQILNRGNLNLTKEKYVSVIEKKTASLFMAAAEVGCLFVSSDKESIESFREFGRNFGIAYQIADDYFDFIKDQNTLGKSPGQDFQKGDITLPLIHLLEAVPENVKNDLLNEEESSRLEKEAGSKKFFKIKELLVEYKIDAQIRGFVQSFVDKAKKSIENIPDSEYKNILMKLVPRQPINYGLTGTNT